jgi:lipid A ethanolaminephosphotransferase
MAEFNIDLPTLRKHSEDMLSHDNIFHSLLGLFGIQNPYYRKDLDIFHILQAPREK